MIAIAQMASVFSLKEQERIHGSMREFELYEEAVRLEAAAAV